MPNLSQGIDLPQIFMAAQQFKAMQEQSRLNKLAFEQRQAEFEADKSARVEAAEAKERESMQSALANKQRFFAQALSQQPERAQQIMEAARAQGVPIDQPLSVSVEGGAPIEATPTGDLANQVQQSPQDLAMQLEAEASGRLGVPVTRPEGLTFEQRRVLAREGRPQVNVGTGQSGLTTSMISQLQGDIESNQQVLSRIGSIEQFGDPTPYLQFVGKAKKSIYDALGKSGLSTPEQDDFAAKATSFNQSVEQLMLAFRKATTGVAGGPQEMDRIEKAYLNTMQSPAGFSATIERIKADTETATRIKQSLLEEGINVKDPNFFKEAQKRWRAEAGHGPGSEEPVTEDDF